MPAVTAVSRIGTQPGMCVTRVAAAPDDRKNERCSRSEYRRTLPTFLPATLKHRLDGARHSPAMGLLFERVDRVLLRLFVKRLCEPGSAARS
jgi:hypothetical protein